MSDPTSFRANAVRYPRDAEERNCERGASQTSKRNLKANRRVQISSGQLNAKQQELMELQALAQRRLKGVRQNFNEGLKTARETKRDLEWTQKRVR